MNLLKRKNNKAFTLLEILLVVAIIAVLAGIVVMAINPTKQLAQGRNTQRTADVATLQRALYQYVIDGNPMPVSLTSSFQDICQSGESGDCIELVELTTDQKYLAAYPVAPGWSDTDTTGYQIKLSDSGRGAEITAANAELGVVISSPPGIVVGGGGGGGGGGLFTVAGVGGGADGSYTIDGTLNGEPTYTNGTFYIWIDSGGYWFGGTTLGVDTDYWIYEGISNDCGASYWETGNPELVPTTFIDGETLCAVGTVTIE